MVEERGMAPAPCHSIREPTPRRGILPRGPFKTWERSPFSSWFQALGKLKGNIVDAHTIHVALAPQGPITIIGGTTAARPCETMYGE